LLSFAFSRAAAGPRYEVKRATSPIVVDGKVDDKAWAAANKVELIFPWDAQTGDKQKTTARLLWDDSYLYVSYECEDTDIVATHTEHDDPTYLDDAVEIFINPMPSQTSIYYGLEMNVHRWHAEHARRQRQRLEPRSGDSLGELRRACATADGRHNLDGQYQSLGRRGTEPAHE
jgi:hypothetical protein